MKNLFFFFFLMATLGALLFCQPQETGIKTERVTLNEVLKKTAEYCERLERIALHFVCHENIIEKENIFEKKTVHKIIEGFTEPQIVAEMKIKRSRKKSYVYDYQLIKEEEEINERRILIRENDKETDKERAELELGRILFKHLVYGPAGFLSQYWQDYFDYEIIRQDNLNEKKVIVINATPKAPREENYNFGKIWIDLSDFRILRIEFDQKSIINFEEKVSSPIGDLKRSISWTIEYGIEKKGIRFPSKQIVEEYLVSPWGKVYPKYSLSVVYDNYKFFTVETEVKYH